MSGFPADFSLNGMIEVTPSGLSQYIQNYTNWDLVGKRMKGEMPISFFDVLRYPIEVSNFNWRVNFMQIDKKLN